MFMVTADTPDNEDRGRTSAARPTRSDADYFARILVPALFALLVSVTIRQHSLSPYFTMPRTVAGLLAVSALSFIALVAVWGDRPRMNGKSAALLTALLFSSGISATLSGNVAMSLPRLGLYLAVALLAVVTYRIYSKRCYLPLTAVFIAIALTHIPFFVAAVLWIRDLDPPFWHAGVRIADFAHVRQFAEFAFLAAASGTGLALCAKRGLAVSMILTGCAVFGILLTGSRGALLAWMMFVFLMSLMGPARLRASVHGLVVLLFASLLVWILDYTGVLASPNLFTRVVEADGGTSDSGRFSLWWASWEQILRHPFFGSGPEGYWISGCCDRTVLQAHNSLLQFLMEFGVVGCALALGLLWTAVHALEGPRGVAKRIAASPANRVLAGLLVSFIAYSMIDQMFYHVVPLLHFGVLAGLLAAGLVQPWPRLKIDQSHAM